MNYISTGDLWEFASALYSHGANIDVLCTALPSWERSDIQMLVNKFRSRAERERELLQKGRQSAACQYYVKKFEKDFGVKSTAAAEKGTSDMNDTVSTEAALVSWCELMEKVKVLQGTCNKHAFGKKFKKDDFLKDHSQLLSKAMLYSACFEDHYFGGSPDDVNYSEIYRYFSQLLAGEELTQLRPRSAAKVLAMVDKLTDMLASGNMDEMLVELLNKDFSTLAQFQSGDELAGSESRFSASSVKLFEDPDDDMDSDNEQQCEYMARQIEKLDPKDPYFSEHLKSVNEKLEEQQKQISASVVNIPGLNPLRLGPEMLTKPPAAFSSTYPYRAEKPVS